ncbi:hypothetical protein NKH77_01235 [Streptomyces sp. M19]
MAPVAALRTDLPTASARCAAGPASGWPSPPWAARCFSPRPRTRTSCSPGPPCC